MNYQDFDLLIDRAGENLRAHVINSPAGQATAEFRLPFSEEELENFLVPLGGRIRRDATRRVETQEMTAAKAFGAALFSAVFSGDVKVCFRSSFDEARRQNAGLRIRLRLADPSVVDLPWEYLYNPAVNRFLALSVHTPLVRYIDLPERIQPISVTLPIRVLVMIPSPRDFPALDVESEWTRLNEALANLIGRNRIAIERLDDATLEALQRRLRREQYHVFHFIGHGEFDDRSQEGVLILEGDQRRGHRVSSRSLGMMLHDHESLRLAMLTACEVAQTSRTAPFAASAQSLVHQGIPAVIAMQFGIADDVGRQFAHEFYGALADGYPIDASLTEARKSIFAARYEVEWGTPVLYLRAPDGRVFDLDTVAPPKPLAAAESGPQVVASPARPSQERITDGLVAAARQAFDDGRRAEAIEMLRRYEPAKETVAQALRELTLEQQRLAEEDQRRLSTAIQEHLRAATDLLNAGNLAAAWGRACDAIQLDPSHAPSIALERLLAAKRKTEAEQAVQTALDALRRDAERRQQTEAVARAEPDPSDEAAIDRLKETLALDPGKETLRTQMKKPTGRLGSLLRGWWARAGGAVDQAEHKHTTAAESRAAGPSDVVHCTVFSPLETACGQPFLVQVIAHVPEQARAAKVAAKESDREAEPRVRAVLQSVTPHVSRLTFCLSVPGAEVIDPVQALIWKRTSESVQFEVRIPRDCTATRLIGTVTVSQDGIPFGHIKFVVSVVSEGLSKALAAQQPRSTTDWKRYRHAFVSYAAADRAEVLKRVQMLARVSIDFFQDVLTLEPGERWERELYKQIDRSDVFFLFWSTAAKNSDWVGREIDYALRRKRGDELAEPEIVPIMIEGPPPVPPPAALRHLHFNDPFMYFIESGGAPRTGQE